MQGVRGDGPVWPVLLPTWFIRGHVQRLDAVVVKPGLTITEFWSRHVALSINHLAIRTLDLAATRRFYVDGLGLADGPRPAFPFPGMWLYSGDTSTSSNAAVHVVGIDPADPEGLKTYLGDRDTSTLHGSGAVDHIAFYATGLASTLDRLRALSIPFRERTVPGLGLHQVFLDDPNGIVVELNFPAAEKQALSASA